MAAPLRLFDVGGPWQVVKRSNPVLCALADRHYPRRRRGWGQVGGPWQQLALLAVDETAGWLSGYLRHPDDGLDAWRCTMFRNEGPALSSALILDAMALTAERWGDPPADGWLTYVDTAGVDSIHPGFCFKRAGWWLDRAYRPGRRRSTLIRLRA